MNSPQTNGSNDEGDLAHKLAPLLSRTAVEAIEELGGSLELLERLRQQRAAGGRGELEASNHTEERGGAERDAPSHLHAGTALAATREELRRELAQEATPRSATAERAVALCDDLFALDALLEELTEGLNDARIDPIRRCLYMDNAEHLRRMRVRIQGDLRQRLECLASKVEVPQAEQEVSAGRGARLRHGAEVKARHVVGIACTGHGASIAYVSADGRVRASVLDRWAGTKHTLLFASEERADILSRGSEIDKRIHDTLHVAYGRFPPALDFEERFPEWLAWILADLDVEPEGIDLVVTSESHFATCRSRLGPEISRWFPRARIAPSLEHHEIHQRQAFWGSGLERAAVVTLDTCGERLERLGGRKLSGSLSLFERGQAPRVLREMLFPESSAGMIYAAANHHIGFRQGEEGKTMGLAPHGRADLYAQLRPYLSLRADGSFEFLSHARFVRVLEEYVPARSPGRQAPLEPRHEDVAFAAQALLEDIVTNAVTSAIEITGCRDVAYAGGVALNCVANEVARKRAAPHKLYVTPNPGDEGHALGCALFGAYEVAGWEAPPHELPDYLGPPYGEEECAELVRASGFHVSRPSERSEFVARCLAEGSIVGHFDGPAEFGPRALGNRSILADPRRTDMKDHLNARVKKREGFRPFAPAVLAEEAAAWFELDGESPYMLRVVPVRPERRADVPAIVHVDGTARVQTVRRSQNSELWELIRAFHERTGVPLLLNTSFNVAGRPIVERPSDALACFAEADIDVLVLGPWVLSKRPWENGAE